MIQRFTGGLGFQVGHVQLRHGVGEDLVHLGKADGVPKLGAEVAIAGDAFAGQLQHAADRRHRGIGKAQCVGTEFVHDFQRVDDVAGGLGHLLALLVADELVQVDGVERDLVHHGQLHHHHPGDPEEQDVEAGDQNVRGKVALQLLGLLGPAQRADGPKAGREPGVEDVWVAPNRINQLGRVLFYCVLGKAFSELMDRFLLVGDFDHSRVAQRARNVCVVVEEFFGNCLKARCAFHDIATVAACRLRSANGPTRPDQGHRHFRRL